MYKRLGDFFKVIKPANCRAQIYTQSLYRTVTQPSFSTMYTVYTMYTVMTQHTVLNSWKANVHGTAGNILVLIKVHVFFHHLRGSHFDRSSDKV